MKAGKDFLETVYIVPTKNVIPFNPPHICHLDTILHNPINIDRLIFLHGHCIISSVYLTFTLHCLSHMLNNIIYGFLIDVRATNGVLRNDQHNTKRRRRADDVASIVHILHTLSWGMGIDLKMTLSQNLTKQCLFLYCLTNFVATT